jgi:hypothetical protein
MNEIALKFLTSANRPELWAVFSGWVTASPLCSTTVTLSSTASCRHAVVTTWTCLNITYRNIRIPLMHRADLPDLTPQSQYHMQQP